MSGKQWGGRFDKPTDRSVEEFTHSLATDIRLWECDIQGSIAHARMLARVGVLATGEGEAIIQGLKKIREELISTRTTDAAGLHGSNSLFHLGAEDVHSEIERLLTERVGPLAGKLHTARSRNDQVATATRLYLRQELDLLVKEVRSLQSWLVGFAEQNLHTLIPGFTHLQHAQPISLAHHFMAYFWMLDRDVGRMEDCRKRLNILPLGSAALAGTSFPIDRQSVAAELEFSEPSPNSLDAVSDRDFIVEFLSGASLILIHLSRLSEELIIWNTPEFGFVEFDDSVTTGSSIMPQKKNPDVAELIRGRSARVQGALAAAQVLLKGLPLSYNRDLQEDKEFLFVGIDTSRSCVRMMELMLRQMQIKTDRIERSLKKDFSNATDLADYLVRRGMSFRQSHEVTGKMVKFCIYKEVGLEDLKWEDVQAFTADLSADLQAFFQSSVGPEVIGFLNHRGGMEARSSFGGTGPLAVQKQIALAKARIQDRYAPQE